MGHTRPKKSGSEAEAEEEVVSAVPASIILVPKIAPPTRHDKMGIGIGDQASPIVAVAEKPRRGRPQTRFCGLSCDT
eukprot:169926-Chlamydomonas_euryale.AAC.1